MRSAFCHRRRRACRAGLTLGLSLGLGFGLGVLGYADRAEAAPWDFSSDRPGIANTTAIAPRHHLISEWGMSFRYAKGQSQLVLPALQLRGGLLEWLELRFKLPAPSWGPSLQGPPRDGVDLRHFGLADPTVGFKVGGKLNRRLHLSSVTDISLPLGSAGSSSERAGVRVDLNVGWQALSWLTLVPNLILQSQAPAAAPGAAATKNTPRAAWFTGSLAAWGQINRRWSAFVQSYATATKGQKLRVAVGGGATFMASDRLQVDLGADAFVTTKTPTIEMSAGASWLF